MSDQKKPESFIVKAHVPQRDKFPSLAQMNTVALKSGPRTIREIVHCAIISAKTGEFKGNSFILRTKHKKGEEWELEPSKTYTLENEDDILRVRSLLNEVYDGESPSGNGRFLYVPEDVKISPKDIGNAIRALSQSGKANLLIKLIERTSQSPEFLQKLQASVSSNKQIYTETSATLDYVRYADDIVQMRQLVQDCKLEKVFQRFLKDRMWIFGSEYSEVINQRVVVRDSEFDFLMRRTSDQYTEIIEIKTPLSGKALFIRDNSHESYYPSSELSKVIGQVQKYIDEVDANRHMIKFKDGEDAYKIRAKIIIGSDLDDAQKAALRGLNGYLHRIEIITFDQLISIGERMLMFVKGVMPSASVTVEDSTAYETPPA